MPDDLDMNDLRDVTATVARLAEVASADAVVGPAQEREGRTVLPLASVSASYGLGMGFGLGEGDGADDPNGEGGGSGGGGGGGGRGKARPVAVVEITDESLRVHQVVDSTRITISSLALAAWSVFWITRAVRGFRR